MPITLDVRETTATIELKDAVDINFAAELKKTLEDALQQCGVVHVDVSTVSSLDVTPVQILWAAAGQARKAGTGFAITGNLESGLAATLSEVGLCMPGPVEPATPLPEED